MRCMARSRERSLSQIIAFWRADWCSGACGLCSFTTGAGYNHGTSSHDDIVNRLPALCEETDRAAAALIQDLKQQGLLDSTIVIWGGEFGRTPMNEARNNSKFLVGIIIRERFRCG